jgi:hypothetical protein
VPGDDLEDVGTPHTGHHRPQPLPTLTPTLPSTPALRGALRRGQD